MGVYKRERERERESTIPYPVVSCLGIVRKYVFEILREREFEFFLCFGQEAREREREKWEEKREREIQLKWSGHAKRKIWFV